MREYKQRSLCSSENVQSKVMGNSEVHRVIPCYYPVMDSLSFGRRKRVMFRNLISLSPPDFARYLPSLS